MKFHNIKSYQLFIPFIFITNLITFLLQLTSRINPSFAEWYANNIYPLLVITISRISGLFPFSFVELLFVLLLCYFLLILIPLPIQRMVRSTHRQHSRITYKKHSSIKNLLHIGAFISLMLLIFNLTCGINYQRNTFASYTPYKIENSSLNDLVSLSDFLIDTTNALSYQIPINEDGVMDIKMDLRLDAVSAMENIGRTYPVLSGYYPKPKPIFNSVFMSYQQITGIYSPFTMEANYNRHIPDYNIPQVMCHELAHLKGFMREDEAEFIAILASRESDNIYFQYSSNLIALTYCLNAIYSTGDKILYASLYDKLGAQVKGELTNANGYWNDYEGFISELSEKANDAYLKVNDQSDGVKSYGRVVDLLLAERKKLVE